MKKNNSIKLLLIGIFALGIFYFDLPASIQAKINPFITVDETTETSSKNQIKLGLDLQGGSQLDYKIDLRLVPEEDHDNIIQGVLEVIERRVNSLGINEPNIYTSEVGGETHIIVELVESGQVSKADISQYLRSDKTVNELTEDERKTISLEKAKATVGKTIQLEFKEQKSPDELNQGNEAQAAEIRTGLQESLQKILDGQTFQTIAQEEQQANPGKAVYLKGDFVYKDEIGSTGIQDTIDELEIGSTYGEIIDTTLGISQDESGQMVVNEGIQIYRLLDKKEEVRHERAVSVSHILISYQGAERATASVTRTQEEAQTLANEVLQKIQNQESSFADLAEEFSDDESNSDLGGVLERPVTNDGSYTFDFESAAMSLSEVGDISDVVEIGFGYHIIKADKIETDVIENKYQIETLTFSTSPDPWKATSLTGKHFKNAQVLLDTTTYRPVVEIQFNSEGAALFEELTKNNVNKPIAIFVGGELISAPIVNQTISGGIATITGNFTQTEAQNLARDLNTGAIPAPIILTGEYTIGASIGQAALHQSVVAGAIGFALVIIFMLAYYRMAGFIAAISLSLYTGIFIFLIKSSLPTYLAIIIAVIILVMLLGRISKNDESGADSIISIIFSIVAFFLFTNLLTSNIVITLAGTAGIILSIGMAVDANILIFERFKEELRNGRKFEEAVNEGFNRAWNAIRDSNFSTLIVCGILYYFGTSIVRGFAFTLAAGILISMFTAITITRALMMGFVGKKIAENQRLFGVKIEKKPKKEINFLKHSRKYVAVSGALIIISIFAGIIFRFTPGIDFTGGSLMEVTIKQESATREDIYANLLKTQELINTNGIPQSTLEVEAETSNNNIDENETETTIATPNDDQIITDENIAVDFTNAQVVESGENGFIIKTGYIDEQTHAYVLQNLRDQYPELKETRFTSIGPTVGKSLLGKAVIAVIVALAMMAIYIRFAFRALPKTVSTWKFGGSAIIALFQNIIITLGVFIILGIFINIEINALFITAMLTVMAYSINDTIVIFDKIRENLLEKPSGNLEEIANKAINQTLARSLNTSISTLIVLIAILIFGSPSIFFFVLAMTIGIAVGTYSSLFIAPPVLVWWHKKSRR
ncbi:protein translocase subunit SecF [Candidatus Peregrinibacteria bacterium HGW-Peregrinibacteria-1]|jgi:preprotein translocase SecF subunit|nr:MAG: protein translocase subunit SecF [Candidatus Peregrinibacteria bacterium HGW-Peregrinibacteria-1]